MTLNGGMALDDCIALKEGVAVADSVALNAKAHREGKVLTTAVSTTIEGLSMLGPLMAVSPMKAPLMEVLYNGSSMGGQDEEHIGSTLGVPSRI